MKNRQEREFVLPVEYYEEHCTLDILYPGFAYRFMDSCMFKFLITRVETRSLVVTVTIAAIILFYFLFFFFLRHLNRS